MIFSKLTTDLVISPIEDMIERINRITEDPLKAANDEEERLLFEELQENDKMFADVNQGSATPGKKEGGRKMVKGDGPMETVVLEQTLSKIGALLALGFGEAGSTIIAQNMKKGDEVNPMLPGIKGMFIFGFCDIRNFTDATEVLEEGVMLFVNEIGEIVHSTANRYSGSPNKNVGDAFLLVWKMEKEDEELDRMEEQLTLK